MKSRKIQRSKCSVSRTFLPDPGGGGVGFQQRWRRNVEGREEVLTLPKSPAPPPLESREGLNVASAFCAGLWTLERHAHKIRASPEREVEPYECLSGCGSSSCRGGGGSDGAMFSLEAAVAPARIRGRATDLLVSLGRPSKEIFLRKHSSLSRLSGVGFGPLPLR